VCVVFVPIHVYWFYDSEVGFPSTINSPLKAGNLFVICGFFSLIFIH